MDARRATVASLAALALMAGCREGMRKDAPAAPDPPASLETASGEWIAVFAVGEPDDLEDESATIEESASENIAVSPASCWEGLPEALAVQSDAYVAAVTAPSRAELEQVVTRVGLEVMFRGRLPGRCGD